MAKAKQPADKPAKTPRAPSTRTRKPTAKAAARKKTVKTAAIKKKKPAAEPDVDDGDDSDDADGSDDEDEDEDEGDDGKTAVPTLDWSDAALSHSLLARITEDKLIKRALYPPPGPNASTKDGGGKTKVEAYWSLCKALLENDDKFKEALAAVSTPKEKKSWGNKMKNRLRVMAKTTAGYMDEMSQTGAGITREADIDMSKDNAFTTKWEEISASCPWFFDMRDLIAQRPNVVPTGVGNSETPFDLQVLTGGSAPSEGEDMAESRWDRDLSFDDDTNDTSLAPVIDTSDDELPTTEELAQEALDDASSRQPDALVAADDVAGDVVAEKPKSSSKGKKRKATTAKAGKSNPAPPPVPTAAAPPAKKSKTAEFAEIAKSEEITRQKELELATLRAKHNLKSLEVKGRLLEQKARAKREDREAKREERKSKWKMKEMRMQYEMARLNSASAGSSHAGSSSFFLDGIAGNALPGNAAPGHYFETDPFSASSSVYASSESDANVIGNDNYSTYDFPPLPGPS